MTRKLRLPLLLVACLITAPLAAVEWTMRATVDGELVEGRPVAWDASTIQLLGPDGRLHRFAAGKAKGAERLSRPFRAMTDSELRAELYREFDGRLDFSSTGHYLVVHPPGAGAEWAGRFEQVYRSLLSYLRVRGFAAREPEFPLVAIVLRNESEYRRMIAESGTKTLPGTVGHYDHYSNRVVLFDVTGGEGDWETNASTIIHEATHQVAFNVGAHTRGADSPYWIPEGLAMLFESPGVGRPRGADRRAERANAGRLADFRRASKNDSPPFALASFVASDQPFKRDGLAAYAQAWALSFYLAETRPREYSSYLATIAARPPLAKYPAAERVADFRAAFGDDLLILEKNWMSWVEGL